jgi:hypothetical protein
MFVTAFQEQVAFPCRKKHKGQATAFLFERDQKFSVAVIARFHTATGELSPE